MNNLLKSCVDIAKSLDKSPDKLYVLVYDRTCLCYVGKKRQNYVIGMTKHRIIRIDAYGAHGEEDVIKSTVVKTKEDLIQELFEIGTAHDQNSYCCQLNAGNTHGIGANMKFFKRKT